MTTTILRRNSHKPSVLLLILVGITMIIPPVVLSIHASLHTEADQIRACFQNPDNLLQVWLNKSGERLNCLVQLPDGKVGNHVIQWSCRQAQFLEITSYILGEGDLSTAIRILREKACTQVFP